MHRTWRRRRARYGRPAAPYDTRTCAVHWAASTRKKESGSSAIGQPIRFRRNISAPAGGIGSRNSVAAVAFLALVANGGRDIARPRGRTVRELLLRWVWQQLGGLPEREALSRS